MRPFSAHSEAFLLEGIAHELPNARRVLAFAPHPDDEVFGCGGALALLAARGALARAVIATDGEAGLPEASRDSSALRREESRRAAEILGCAAPEFWGLPDRGLDARSLIDRIATAIVRADAELVFLPSPLEIHPDHQALGLAAMAALGMLPASCEVWFYEVSRPLGEPTHLIPIDATLDKKRLAIRCFTSQLAQLPYEERMIGLNRFRAFYLGERASAAEAFVRARCADPEALRRLFAPELRVRHLLKENRRQLHRNLSLAQANAELARTVSRLEEAVQAYRNTVSGLEEAVQAYRNSTSWRITAPLRAIAARLRRMLPRNRSRDA